MPSLWPGKGATAPRSAALKANSFRLKFPIFALSGQLFPSGQILFKGTSPLFASLGSFGSPFFLETSDQGRVVSGQYEPVGSAH